MVAKNIEFWAQRYLYRRIVLDASVLLKFFLGEDGKDQVAELLRLNGKKQLSIFYPSLLEFEVFNTIAKKGKALDQVSDIYDKVKRFNFVMVEPDWPNSKKALLNAAGNKRITYYDASYHAVAKDFEATFITADKDYYELMKDEGDVELFEVVR